MLFENKAKMIAALASFQVATSVVSASTINSTAMVAENDEMRVTCKVSDLEPSTSWGKWVVERSGKAASNEETLNNVNENFAGGDYFDKYPHKLPSLFKAGSCTIESTL